MKFLSRSCVFCSLRCFGGGVGIRSEEGGACCGIGPRGAAHRRRQTRRPRGRTAAAATVVLGCGSVGRNKVDLGFSQGATAYIPCRNTGRAEDR
jgi:hypothetical protein